MFVYAWMCALTHFSYYKFKVDYIFLPEELSAWMENKYCKVPLSKVSVVWERWFKFIVYLFVVNICSVQTLYKHWTGWPLNRMILSKYWKEVDEIWILPGKTHEEKCVCFLFACRKHVLLVSWFARFALYVFDLNLLLKVLAIICYVNYCNFCSCSDSDPSFVTLSFIFWYYHVVIKIKLVFLSVLSQHPCYTSQLFFWRDC